MTDTTGVGLPRVVIRISSPDLIGTRTALIDDEGFYQIPALPPGEYALVFALQGFRTARREGVHVSGGFTATIDVVMDLATLQEQIVVSSDSPLIDKQSTAVASRFDAVQLANLPGARSTSTILALTPAIHVNRFDVGGNTASLGVNYSAFGTMGNNRPMIEGIDTTGVMGTGFVFDSGSLDEVSVYTGAHNAEWPKPGVQMQFIAKSGGNQYAGTLYADYGNRAWQSFNVDGDQIARGTQGGGDLSPREVNRLWNYRDINTDVGGYIAKDRLWWYSSFRDQEVAARYVNFAITPHRTRATNYSGKGTYQVTPNHKLVAYGQVGRTDQPHYLATTAIYESDESTTKRLGWGRVVKGEWNAVVQNTVFVEARVSQFGSSFHEQPNGSARRFEDVIRQTVAGGSRDFLGTLRREQVFGSVSRFKPGWLGNHHFKAGGEVYRTTQLENWRSTYPGEVLHVLRNGTPLEVVLFETPSRSEAGLWTYGSYFQDTWRLNDRLTLSLGLRLDRFRIFLPAQEHPAGRFTPAAQRFAAVNNIIDWNVPGPRIGAIVDPASDGRAILKFNYGQYWVNPGVATGFNANPNSSQWWRRYTWSDLNRSGFWEPGEEGTELGRRGGAAIESLDPALALPFVREAAASVEAELQSKVAVRASVIWRTEQQHMLRTNANQPFGAFTEPMLIPDPGPDGVPGTLDDGRGIEGRQLSSEFLGRPPVNIVRNVPDGGSQYWTLDLTAGRRLARRWSLAGGFAHTWSRDQASTYSGQSVRQNMFPLTPNDFIYADGNGRHAFTIWTAKLHGTYEAPCDFRITPLLRHQSGQPFGRTFSTSSNYGNIQVLAEPIGTRRMDNVTLVDVRVEKAFHVRLGRLVAFVDMFNVFNANPEQNISWSSGSFLRPLTVVAPRIARIGTKLAW